MRWDIFVMVLALWNCISIPFDVSFEPEKYLIYELFETFVDICFGLDIIIAFRTTYINTNTGFEVIEARKIALNYIVSGRFFVDLAASIPIENVYIYFADIDQEKLQDGTATQENLQLKLLGLLKLVRLLRLGRIIRYMKFK